MRRRTKIVLAITLMVTALVTAFSYIFISQLLNQVIATASQEASNISLAIARLANEAAPDLSDTHVDQKNLAKVRSALAYYLSTDRDLNASLKSTTETWAYLYDAAIVDEDGKAILDTTTELVGKIVPERPQLQQLKESGFRRKLELVYGPGVVFEQRSPLDVYGRSLGTVRVGVSTVFLKNEVAPHLRRALTLSGLAILCSMLLASVITRLAFGPLEQISESLDSMSEEDFSEHNSRDEYGLVTLKIAHLGRQMRDAKEIFSALKDNVDQIMANLQDGLMLFTRDARVVLVSASVERFLERPRRELLGRTAQDIFSSNTEFGALVLDAFENRRSVASREFEWANGKRVQVSLDFIHERGAQIGALLTLRDAESVRRIEDEIEMSRRLSASGRLTRGVAHEVKNPINAIVLHLQLLQNKLEQVDPDTRRHMDIIDSEIHRLDRVVQILVDFTRARELRMEDISMRRMLEDVAMLAAPDAQQHGVEIRREFSLEPLPVKADSDFMKQAILNVVLNGVQAMPEGGVLLLAARRDEDTVVMEISDQGGGIPPEVQEKIFELYFTTKKEGSGIGLAQTYQIMQWHYGSVEFETEEGKGTTFRLRLPLAGERNHREEAERAQVVDLHAG